MLDAPVNHLYTFECLDDQNYRSQPLEVSRAVIYTTTLATRKSLSNCVVQREIEIAIFSEQFSIWY